MICDKIDRNVTLEAIAEIETRLAARKLGVKFETLPVNSSPTLLDVEDAFLEDVVKEPKLPLKSVSKPTFDSEPE